MIVPLIAGAAALYGIFRYKKAQEAKELNAFLPTPPAPPAGFAPSPAMARAIAPTVTAAVPKQNLAQKLFAGVQSVASAPPSAIPSSRIPSSAYGTASPPGPTPDAPTGYSASGSIQIKL